MAEYAEYRSKDSILPQTLLTPIKLETDIEHYKNEIAPPRRNERGDTFFRTRLDHIRDHEEDLLKAMKCESIDEAINRMGKIAESNDDNRFKEFVVGKGSKILKYDTETGVLLAIRKFKSPNSRPGDPESGELITAYIMTPEEVLARVNPTNEQEVKHKWYPSGRAIVH